MVATRSILVPIHLIPVDKIDSIRETARAKLEEIAARDFPNDILVTRDLMPTDLGLTNEVWYETTGATANRYEDSAIADKAIADNVFVCIWGVTDLSDEPAVSALRITVGSSKIAIWNLDKMIQMVHKAAITLSPIIITQNTKITIEHFVKIANAGVEIAFDGCVTEKEGINLKIS